MTDQIKLLDSAEYAEIKTAFRKKLRPLTNNFEDAIDENDKVAMSKYFNEARDLIVEYEKTAESLAQYGSGVKKTKFLEAYEDDIDYLKTQMEQASHKLNETAE